MEPNLHNVRATLLQWNTLQYDFWLVHRGTFYLSRYEDPSNLDTYTLDWPSKSRILKHFYFPIELCKNYANCKKARVKHYWNERNTWNHKLSVTRSEDNLKHTWIQIFRTVYSIAIQGSEKRASYLKVRSIRGSACTIPEIKSCQTIFTEYQYKLHLSYENKRGFPNLS